MLLLYTRVISSKPSLEHHYHKSIRNFTKYLSSHAESITEKESEKIEEELKDVLGFIDVPEKEKEIDKRLGDIVEADEHLKDIASAIEGLASQEGYDLEKLDS
jgi:flagellar motility protein MotE (MotC chaperone)